MLAVAGIFLLELNLRMNVKLQPMISNTGDIENGFNYRISILLSSVVSFLVCRIHHPAGTEDGPSTFGHLACADERVFLGRGSVPAGLKRQCMHDVTL